MKKVILTRLSLLTAPGAKTDLLTSGMVVEDQVSVDEAEGRALIESFKSLINPSFVENMLRSQGIPVE